MFEPGEFAAPAAQRDPGEPLFRAKVQLVSCGEVCLSRRFSEEIRLPDGSPRTMVAVLSLDWSRTNGRRRRNFLTYPRGRGRRISPNRGHRWVDATHRGALE